MSPGKVRASSILVLILASSSSYNVCCVELSQEQSLANQDTGGHQVSSSPASSADLYAKNGACSSAGFLLADPTDRLLNETDAIDSTLLSVLARKGADMRPLRDFHDFDDITPSVAKRAWKLMHQHAQRAATDKVRLARPLIEQALSAANVSNSCFNSIEATLAGVQELHSWAIQLVNSWGNFPPVGLYEGTYGDIGSFHVCLNVPHNSAIGHSHYCTVSFRPVLPPRRDYELVISKEPAELLNLFDRTQTDAQVEDAFTPILEHTQYSHYVYYKLGTCFPIGCSPYDVQRLAKLVGRQSILMTGPVKCHSKFENDYESSAEGELQISTRDLNQGVYIWKPHMTGAQSISLTLVALITCFIISMTIIDVAVFRAPKLLNEALEKRRQSLTSTSSVDENSTSASVVPRFLATVITKKNRADQDTNNNFTLTQLNGNCNGDTFGAEKGDTFKTINLDDAQKASSSLNQRGKKKRDAPISLFRELVDDFSIVTNTRQFFHVSPNQLKNDILCINGIRCITMSWIIITHTMQYNDWSAFARIRDVEVHLKSLINQPLFNGSYLVDTFFLISGLLTSYSSFRINNCARISGNSNIAASLLTKFSAKSYLIGRYLRLTPQIMFVSLLFILLPQLSRSGGPHWYTMTGEYSENCSQNWWVNLLHLQAFYRSNEMCNFVSWWISVDMFYHLFALAAILTILSQGHRLAWPSCAILVAGHAVLQTATHYQLALPPNLLSTIPQSGAMWSKMTLEFFWTPKAHASPFFLGLYLGYLMAQRHSKLVAWFNPRRALIGWTLSICLFIAVSYSTYFWVIGRWQYHRLVSTLFFLICPMIWAACLAWVILACQYGYGSWINQMLSCKLFIVLGKASYLVYLSHFLVLFTFFGAQNLLLEPTQLLMTYVILGNICLSMMFGSLLCIVFEMPWLKTHRRIMRLIR